MIAAIITPWTGSGSLPNDAYRPALCDNYPTIAYRDLTGQPSENIQPSPNLFLAYVECDGSTLDSIEGDNAYLVIWSTT